MEKETSEIQLTDLEQLYKKYFDEERSDYDIAQEMDVKEDSVRRKRSFIKEKIEGIKKGKEQKTKEEIFIDLFHKANKEYKVKFPAQDGDVTRNYFREFLERNSEDQSLREAGYNKVFGSFSVLKRQAFGLLDRDDLNIIKDNSKNSSKKKYIVSAIIQGAEINYTFLDSLLNYCTQENAELVLLTMRGVSLKDYYGKHIYDKLGKYFATEFKFNDNLVAKDFILNPQQIIPSTGLLRFGKKDFSLIIASPKQFMTTVPTKKDALPHIVYTTGTINTPVYRQTRVGAISEQDNQLGALVVEVEDSSKFHIRNILFDDKKGFTDLSQYYTNEGKPTKVQAEAMVLGDIHAGVEDKVAIEASIDQIKELDPKHVIFHDLFDSNSVSHHLQNDMMAKLKREEHQKTLERELDYAHDFLRNFISECGYERNYAVVPSNHDDFINRYLTQRRFIDDDNNIILACKLFVELYEDNHPVEAYFNKIKEEPFDSLKFLDIDDSFEIDGVELNLHGDKGNNGARGNAPSLETSIGAATTGHTHSPAIYRSIYVAGCNCKLHQHYNKGGASSWLHANVVQYKGGFRQMIITIDGKWKL